MQHFDAHNSSYKKENEKYKEKKYVYNFLKLAQHPERFWNINERNLIRHNLNARRIEVSKLLKFHFYLTQKS